MFGKINDIFNLNKNLLDLYSKREEILSSNIANADTPNYKSIDIDFKNTFKKILQKNNMHSSQITLNRTSKHHLQSKLINNDSSFIMNNIINVNGNTVDMNRERTEFLKNTLKYEENLIFIKNEIKNIMRVLKG